MFGRQTKKRWSKLYSPGRGASCSSIQPTIRARSKNEAPKHKKGPPQSAASFVIPAQARCRLLAHSVVSLLCSSTSGIAGIADAGAASARQIHEYMGLDVSA